MLIQVYSRNYSLQIQRKWYVCFLWAYYIVLTLGDYTHGLVTEMVWEDAFMSIFTYNLPIDKVVKSSECF